MSAKLRDEIEAKRAKLQELRQARLARQRQDSERRASVGSLPMCNPTSRSQLSLTFPTSLDTRQVPSADRCK